MSSKTIDINPAAVEFMHATGHPGASLFKVAPQPAGPTPEQIARMSFSQRMALSDALRPPSAPRPTFEERDRAFQLTRKKQGT